MITSKQNEKILLIKSLYDKKNRDELNLFLAEGLKTVKEAFIKKAKVKYLVVTEKGLSLLNNFSYNAETLLVTDNVFSSISDEKSPQGIMAVIEKPIFNLSCPENSCLILNSVSDPSNVGAIIRTAAASGYTEIYTTEGTADPYGPKAVRASMSGIFAVKIFNSIESDILEVIDCPIYVADMNGKNVFNFTKDEKFCLVIGNEGHGISENIKNKADDILSIPMRNDIESLNAGVSAGILMYALKNFKE